MNTEGTYLPAIGPCIRQVSADKGKSEVREEIKWVGVRVYPSKSPLIPELPFFPRYGTVSSTAGSGCW